MTVAYLAPLARSWARMRRSLFSTFRLENWLVIGFAAWLSQLGRGGYGINWVGSADRESRGEMFDGALETALDFLATPLGLGLALSLGCCAIVLVLLFMWLSSRGKFVFLDDVARERAAIVEPWKTYGPQGDSLFLWRLLFGLAILVTLVVLAGTAFLVVRGTETEELGTGAVVILVLAAAFVLLPLMVVLAYVYCFLNHFVVPIMYRDRVGTMEGWRRFLRVFGRRPFPFLVYGLLLLLLHIALAVGICVGGCLTCCCGFVLLALPYIGAVVLLPFSWTFRAYGPEFLAQFGPEHWTWPAPTHEAPASTPPPAPSS